MKALLDLMFDVWINEAFEVASAGVKVSYSAGLKMSAFLGIGIAVTAVEHSIRRRTARTAKKMSNL